MAGELMYIQNDCTQNYPFRRLKLMVETFRHSTQTQAVKQTNKKTLS